MSEDVHELPREADRRRVEDADARGIAVRLEGGETWYVPPLPLSPRGGRIADLMDAMMGAEVRLQSAIKRVEIAERALMDAEDVEAVDAAEERLRDYVRQREAVSDDLQAHCSQIAYHALRCMYEVTEDEAKRLVSQRYFEEVLQAVNGQSTQTSDIEFAAQVMARLGEVKGGNGGDAGVPFASAMSGGTGAAFS